MTKLEKDIYEATKQARNVDQDVFTAKEAAEVAKKYIEKAVIDIMKEDYAMGGQELNEETMHELLNVWLKENGVIE